MNKIISYAITLKPKGRGVTTFRCDAESDSDARTQAQNAYPGCTILLTASRADGSPPK